MNVQLPIAVSSLPGPTGEGVDNLPVPGDNIPGVPLPPDELTGKRLCTSHLKPVVLSSSFGNALQGLVRGFKKSCHSRVYTHRTLV